MILKFWISSRGWAADKTAALMLLDALHFYTVMTIHLFIILTSGIHCVVAARSRESAAAGKALTPLALCLASPSSPLGSLLFSSSPSLCQSLGPGDLSLQKKKKTEELDNEILAKGTIN